MSYQLWFLGNWIKAKTKKKPQICEEKDPPFLSKFLNYFLKNPESVNQLIIRKRPRKEYLTTV